MALSRPLIHGKRYHFNVIYNHANSPLSATPDNKKALEYTETVVSLLESIGFDKSFYHKRDARAGRDIFDELFRVVNESGFTLLILTRGFLDSCWSRYSGRSAFKKCIDKGTGHRVIALAFNIPDNEVPAELNHHNVSHFTGDPDVDADRWQCLKQGYSYLSEDGTRAHLDFYEDFYIRPGAYEGCSNMNAKRGDNRLHTDDQNLVAHPSDQASLPGSINMEGDGASLMRNLSMDGDRGSRSMSGANGPMAPVHSDTQSIIYSRVSPGTQTSAIGPPRREVSQGAQQNNLSRGGGELKTEVLQGREPVTADISQIRSPQFTRHVSSYTTLEASPTLCAPPVIKKPPSTSERKDTEPHHSTRNEMASGSTGETVDTCPKVLPGDETVTGEINSGCESLSQDDDLTLDNGSQIGVASTRENDDIMFRDLPLTSLETDTIQKQLIDSACSSEKASPEARQEFAHLDGLNTTSNAELSTEVSESGLGMSASSSKDSIEMQNIEEIPKDEKFESTTELGQVPGSSFDKPPNDISEMVTEENVIVVEQMQSICQVPDSSLDKPPNEISEMATKKDIIEEEQMQNTCQVPDSSLDKPPNEISEMATKENVKEEEKKLMQSTCQVPEPELTENRGSDSSLTEVNDSNRVGSEEEMTQGNDEASGLAEWNMNEDSRSSIYRPAPEGEAADERIGNGNLIGGAATAQSAKSEDDPDKIDGSEGTTAYNWMLFGVHSVCRAISRTDALL